MFQYHTTAYLCALIMNVTNVINPLECRGNYSATLNNMKLVHWSLMGVLLH